MSATDSNGLSRRLMLGALAAMPALPGLLAGSAAQAKTGAPLASWNDGPAKQAILDFIRATTDPSSKDFVPPAERIAAFDQDGSSGSTIRSIRRRCFVSNMSPTSSERGRN